MRDLASIYALPVVALGAVAGHFLSTFLWGASLSLFAYSVGTYLACILRGRAEAIKGQDIPHQEESRLRIVFSLLMLGLCSIPALGMPLPDYGIYLAAMAAGMWAGHRSGVTSNLAAGALVGGLAGIVLAVLVGIPLWYKGFLPWSTALGVTVGSGVTLATLPVRSPRWSLDPYGSAWLLVPVWPFAGVGLARLCLLYLPEQDQHYGMLGELEFATPIYGAVIGLYLGTAAGLFSRKFHGLLLYQIGDALGRGREG